MFPDLGWVKLNTDSASKGNPSDTGAGGLFGDHMGTLMIVFSEYLGIKTNVKVELPALLRCLELDVDMGTTSYLREAGNSKLKIPRTEHSDMLDSQPKGDHAAWNRLQQLSKLHATCPRYMQYLILIGMKFMPVCF
ncbi:UNVERIFIED_CONTAM: hypothetical protein Scaly_2376400 [Sesamum calycinum]|uniref:Uncharacterized protein n=1 Tax=Sesamum calycinum TaxID=2727403 RepID=A0AAW2LZ22_9LAMI